MSNKNLILLHSEALIFFPLSEKVKLKEVCIQARVRELWELHSTITILFSTTSSIRKKKNHICSEFSLHTISFRLWWGVCFWSGRRLHLLTNNEIYIPVKCDQPCQCRRIFLLFTFAFRVPLHITKLVGFLPSLF